MQIIPVLDLLGGIVVGVFRGLRAGLLVEAVL